MYEPNLIDSSRVKSDKLVVDTDAGGDDAMALLLLLSVCANNNTHFDIVAITCTYGNSGLSNVENNVLKTLAIANETKVILTRKHFFLFIVMYFKPRINFFF